MTTPRSARRPAGRGGRAANRFSASVEVGADGWATIWVPELAGLFLNGSTERETLREIPQAIKAYQRWLRGHGEPVRVTAAPAVDVVQRSQARARMRWGNTTVLHDFQRPRLTQPELARGLRWMGFMRWDTLLLLAALPPAGLDWTKPGQARTIAQHLRHVANAERWYLDRLALGPFPDLGRTTDPLERIARVRRMTLARLAKMTREERARIRKVDGEWWSARKMLSRILYHERYHLRSMARIGAYHRVRVPERLGGWVRY